MEIPEAPITPPALATPEELVAQNPKAASAGDVAGSSKYRRTQRRSALGANASPEVTHLFCRLPLVTLLH